MIVVCPLSRVAETLANSGARRVVTLLARDQQSAVPHLPGVDRLVLDLSDISEPQPGYTLPGEDHMSELLRFARAWDRRHPLLIHCYAGVSRSTAAAFGMACALDPGAEPREVAARLRAASPNATPNPRLVALADAALGRDGAMIEAIRAIGRGRDCFEGDVFSLEVPALGSADHTPAYQA